MHEEKGRTLAYLCPVCRQAVAVERSVFQLAAASSSLPCPCGQSSLSVGVRGHRIELTVPCLFCGRDHTAACPTQAFLSGGVLAFSCAASGLDCCYVGDAEAVFPALQRLEEAADKLEGAAGGQGAFLDELVMHEVLSELRDIAARGGISCACGSAGWKMEVKCSCVNLRCDACGGVLRIPAAVPADIDDICCKENLQIKARR